MTLQLVRSMHDRLSDASNKWPRHPFTNADRCAVILERRLARVARGREIDFCVASVDEEAGETQFSAVLFTPDLVICGSLRAPNEPVRGGQVPGDVVMVPRSALRSLTLHSAECFGHDDEETEDYVSFTATYEGMDPVSVGPPAGGAVTQVTTRLLDALQSDLAGA